VAVTGPAGIAGGKGMQVHIDDNTAIYVTDQTPAALSRYRARFYFDPNSIRMTSGDTHYVFYGYMGTSTVILRLEFRYHQGDYQVHVGVINDAGSWSTTTWSAIRDQRHLIELDWRAATIAGANDGGVTLWVDEQQVGDFSNVHNDARRMDFVRLGPISGIDPGTRGTYFIDGFESRSSTYIGPDPGAPAIPTALPVDALFDDGFETATMAGWSANVPDAGDLSVSASAGLAGAYGLRAVLDDNTSIYVTDWSPYADRRYRARFYFDPNSITMASGNAHYLLYAYLKDTTTGVLRLEFRCTTSACPGAGTYQVRAEAATDTTSWSGTSWYAITDASHYFEIDWGASSAPGANNGVLKLWIDGVLKQTLSTIDNDTRQIDWVRLGAVSGVDTGTRGTYYFDAFTSTRSSYIGQHYENVTATFVYDGDGRRLKGTVNGVTTVIVGDHYELRTDGEGTITREYYFAGGSPIAARELPSGKLSWLITDHLGSISAASDVAGTLTAELRYRAFGDVRHTAGILPTAYQYTGQRAEPLLGLDDYRARWYDPGVARFTRADPLGGGDRYVYSRSNPIQFTDPTGFLVCEDNPCLPPRVEPPPSYIVGFEGEFTASQKDVLNESAFHVALRLAGLLSRLSRMYWGIGLTEETHLFTAEEAVLTLYPRGLTFVRSQEEPGWAAQVNSLNQIEVFDPNWMVRHPRNIVHEIGHWFNNAFAKAPQSLIPADLLRENYNYGTELTGFNGFAGGQWKWQFSLEDRLALPTETFADMFVGWAYASWNLDVDLGVARQRFMDTSMTLLIGSVLP